MFLHGSNIQLFVIEVDKRGLRWLCGDAIREIAPVRAQPVRAHEIAIVISPASKDKQ